MGIVELCGAQGHVIIFFHFLLVLQAVLAISGIRFVVGIRHDGRKKVAVQIGWSWNMFVPVIRKRAVRILREPFNQWGRSLNGVAVDVAADDQQAVRRSDFFGEVPFLVDASDVIVAFAIGMAIAAVDHGHDFAE